MLTPRQQYVIGHTLSGWQLCAILVGEEWQQRMCSGIIRGTYVGDPHSAATGYQVDAGGIALIDVDHRILERITWDDIADHVDQLPDPVHQRIEAALDRGLEHQKRRPRFPSRQADPDGWARADCAFAAWTAERSAIGAAQTAAATAALQLGCADPESPAFTAARARRGDEQVGPVGAANSDRAGDQT